LTTWRCFGSIIILPAVSCGLNPDIHSFLDCALLRVCLVCGDSETSFENTGQETSTDISQTLGYLELHNDLTHYYNVPGVSDVAAG